MTLEHMNPHQIEYLLRHYQTRSVKELAEELRIDAKEVRRELRKILAQGRREGAGEPVRPAVFHPSPWFHGALVAAALVLAFLVFYPSLRFPLLNWDDPRYITENPLIRSLSAENIRAIFTQPHFSLYIPLTLVSFAIDYQFTHFDPTGYHVTNLILHLLNTGLVYALVRHLTGEWLAALAVAFFFGIHPVQIESVVWIAERKNVLSSFFFLLSFLTYAFSSHSKKPRALLAASWLFFAAVAVALVFAVLKDRRLFFWAAWYWILLLPVMNFIPFPSLMNDRYLYLPMIGFFTFLALLSIRFLGRIPAGVLLAAMLFLFSFFQGKRLEVWANPETLWLETQAKLGGARMSPYLNLGMHYLAQGKTEEAIAQFEKVLEIGDDPSAVVNLGNAYYRRGDYDRAFEYFRKATAMPEVAAGAHNNLGRIYWHRREFDLAMRSFKEAIRLEAQNPVYYNNLGSFLLERGRDEEAGEYLQAASKLDPDFAASLFNLGLLHYKKQDLAAAQSYWTRLLKLHPDYEENAGVYRRLGVAFATEGDSAAARAHFTESLRLDPASAETHKFLGVLAAEEGKLEEGIAHFREAARLDPASAEAHTNLGAALDKAGQTEEAILSYEKTVALDPDYELAVRNLKVARGKRSQVEI